MRGVRAARGPRAEQRRAGAGRLGRRGSAAAALALLVGLATGAGPAAAAEISALTYNVAGLPEALSSSSPEENTPQISPHLNGFDLAAVQEDFAYHEELTSAIDHPYRTEKDTGFGPGAYELSPNPEQVIDPALLGDGLNRFARSPFEGFERVQWDDCFGVLSNASDCLAPKGFSYARHDLGSGATLDVYNLHADAGGAEEDLAARRANLRQLADFVTARSEDRAVLVLGDTNSRYTRSGDILPEFLADTGLTDVWVELARGGDAPAPGTPALQDCEAAPASGGCEVVDKIFYRSGGGVRITPTEYSVPPEFVDADGAPLSDHLPIAARLQVVPEPASGLLVALGLGALAARRRGAGSAAPLG